MKINRILSLLLLALLTTACGSSNGNESSASNQPARYTYSIPAQTNDGWATGHLDDHGFDTALIMEMMDGISNGNFQVSIL